MSLHDLETLFSCGSALAYSYTMEYLSPFLAGHSRELLGDSKLPWHPGRHSISHDLWFGSAVSPKGHVQKAWFQLMAVLGRAEALGGGPGQEKHSLKECSWEGYTERERERERESPSVLVSLFPNSSALIHASRPTGPMRPCTETSRPVSQNQPFLLEIHFLRSFATATESRHSPPCSFSIMGSAVPAPMPPSSAKGGGVATLASSLRQTVSMCWAKPKLWKALQIATGCHLKSISRREDET